MKYSSITLLIATLYGIKAEFCKLCPDNQIIHNPDTIVLGETTCGMLSAHAAMFEFRDDFCEFFNRLANETCSCEITPILSGVPSGIPTTTVSSSPIASPSYVPSASGTQHEVGSSTDLPMTITSSLTPSIPIAPSEAPSMTVIVPSMNPTSIIPQTLDCDAILPGNRPNIPFELVDYEIFGYKAELLLDKKFLLDELMVNELEDAMSNVLSAGLAGCYTNVHLNQYKLFGEVQSETAISYIYYGRFIKLEGVQEESCSQHADLNSSSCHVIKGNLGLLYYSSLDHSSFSNWAKNMILDITQSRSEDINIDIDGLLHISMISLEPTENQSLSSNKSNEMTTASKIGLGVSLSSATLLVSILFMKRRRSHAMKTRSHNGCNNNNFPTSEKNSLEQPRLFPERSVEKESSVEEESSNQTKALENAQMDIDLTHQPNLEDIHFPLTYLSSQLEELYEEFDNSSESDDFSYNSLLEYP